MKARWMNTKGRKKIIKSIFLGIGAAAILTVATCTCWWYGIFLPHWIQWKTADATFGDVSVALEQRSLSVKNMDTGEVVWETQGDWFVQDMILKDLDRDGEEEMILLVWKHGSYGEHMPFWEKKNDVALKQHIFIYKYDEKRDTKVKPIWMSSQINYEIESLASGDKSFLNVKDRTGNTRAWVWRDFGLKLVN
ncbi:MAG: hypothetical protein II477_12495 [Lachnospiraceae bacterium]|nr:hypothetical protein [Lachnospiraceae bacterium]MBQ2101868.1 hypothetical protein [Lachnospiraceae bacterium]MBQ3906440.1 hypothetical protein [Lachnospiraceae bacterium]